MEIHPNGLPIIDFSSITTTKSDSSLIDLSSRVAKAVKSTGCFYLINHGIDPSLLQNTFTDFHSFFTMPVDYKMQFALEDRKRGYMPLESINFNAFLGRPGYPEDPIERMVFGPLDSKDPRNVWPDHPGTLQANGKALYSAMQTLTGTVTTVLASITEEKAVEITKACDCGPNMMKVNFYPGTPSPKPMQTDRLAEHLDASAFTIVANHGDVGGLQVKNEKGEWVSATPVPGALFINLGWVLEKVMDGQWKATMHKVGWSNKEDMTRDRLSLVYFVSQTRFVDETSRVNA